MARASCVPEPRPACDGSARCTRIRAPRASPRTCRTCASMRRANWSARSASSPSTVSVSDADADTSSVGAGAAAPMPPNHRPMAPRRSSTPKCRRAGASTKTASSTRVVIRLADRRRRGADEVAEDGHRLVLGRPGGLVHDHLQPRQFLLDERPVQQVEPGGVDGGLEHGMRGAIEADELAGHAAMDHGHLDPRPRRRRVDRRHLQFAPRAAAASTDAVHHGRRRQPGTGGWRSRRAQTRARRRRGSRRPRAWPSRCGRWRSRGTASGR